MKKYFKLLLCAAFGLGAFTACEDVPAPYNIPSDTPTPVTPTADYIINQTFTSSLGEFTSQSESGDLAWTSSSRYGAIITGYDDWNGTGTKSNKPGVTLLVSPIINLTECDSAYVIIDQAINYAKTTLNEDHAMLIIDAEKLTSYIGLLSSLGQSLPMSFDGLGTSFTYVSQNVQIPQEYIGKSVQIALKHIAHDSYSSTWEVKSLSVAKGQAPANSGDTPIEGLVGTGTKDDPYDVPSTIKLIAAGPPSTKIYTKGKISKIDEIDTGSFGNATYYISNDGTTTDQLEVYRGYGLGGAKFTSTNDLKVGDDVIVYGQVVYYNNKTMEFTQGSELYMHNGEYASSGEETGIEVTCAEAVELTNALADGATSTETYSITGYITEVVGSVSRDQQTFWMADTKDGGKVFEAYWANLPEGVTEFKKGMKVKITGKLLKYVNNSGQMTPEIKNANVEILENGDTPVTPPAGTEITCAQAVELTNALADGATSSETYSVTGYITEIVGSVSRNQQTFWMADTKDGGKVFEAYWADLPEGVTEFKKGMKVKITGKLLKYVNNSGQVTPEIKNAYVEILENGDTPVTPPAGTEITCAQAVELTNALDNGANSTETYSVTGYITEVISSVSRNQQSFWMADTNDGGKVFEAYYANLPEGVTEFKKGMKVKITGQLLKYVNNSGQVTPEIKNANVEILENGDTPGPGPTPGGSTLDDFSNGDFETWTDGQPDGWINSATNGTLSQSTIAHGGSYSCKIEKYTQNKRLACNPMTLSAGTYTLSAWVRAESSTGVARLGNVTWQNGSPTNSYVYGGSNDFFRDITTEWTQISRTIEISADGTYSFIIMNSKESADNLLVDDVTIVKN